MSGDTATKTPPPLLAQNAHYVNVDAIPWEKTKLPGSERKVLYSDPVTGAATILFRMAPGGVVPLHEHPELEQTYVLEGSLVDDEGDVTAGNFVWRPGGSRHVAHCPNGALFIAFFQKPSRPITEE